MKGSNIAGMAWRNLWRHRRRTGLTLSGIAFGTMLAILFTGMGDSGWTEMINLAARMGFGHVSIQHPEYLETPSLGKTITGTDRIRGQVLGDSEVKRVATRITGHALLATAGQNLGALFLAIDPASEDSDTLSVLKNVAKEDMFDSARSRGILLGERLAENLGVKKGRKVVYTMTDKQGEIVSGLARVRGIIRTGAPSVDAGLCLLPIDTVRALLGYGPDEATLMAVYVDDHRQSAQVAGRLKTMVAPEAIATTWRESQPELAGFISMKVFGTLFFEVIIMILVAAGIFNTLFMSVMERLREFGIMMAIGFSPARLFGLVMWESLWLGLVGLATAALVTAIPYYYFTTKGLDASFMIGDSGSMEVSGVAMEPVFYVDIFPENALLIATAVLLTTLLSGLYPAWKAGRVVPVESIKLV